MSGYAELMNEHVALQERNVALAAKLLQFIEYVEQDTEWPDIVAEGRALLSGSKQTCKHEWSDEDMQAGWEECIYCHDERRIESAIKEST